MKKAGALASALRSSGSAVAASPAEAEAPPQPSAPEHDRQQSRRGTKAITVHFPEEVRRQLKAMAGEQGRDVADMVAEGLNLLFAKYRKAELAPRKASK
jgi:Spy/CpxP family protein refolding chaperone